MRDYLLFLDTEASGLPKKWNLPYSNSSNWPCAVQIAWVVYTKDGNLVKTENHYIEDRDIKINPSAIKIHGITKDFLKERGEGRNTVMQLFADDLLNYQPLVLGHFMEFDYHIASADFHRAGISNPLENLPTYCTMRATSFYVRDPSVGHLRLGELYSMLFDDKLENQHNALVDANATADCFFELLKRGDINDEKIELQQSEIKQPQGHNDSPWFISFFVVLVMAILISLWV